MREVVSILRKDGVIVCPTDTVYSFACVLGSSKGFERIARLKGIRPNKAHFSILCTDLSDLSKYSRPVPNEIFKLMKRALPGPFTFILQSGGNLPKLYRSTKKTIGIRVPDNSVVQSILKEIIKQQVFGKMSRGFSGNSFDNFGIIYIIVCVVFYIIQIYNNFKTCYTFYNNINWKNFK